MKFLLLSGMFFTVLHSISKNLFLLFTEMHSLNALLYNLCPDTIFINKLTLELKFTDLGRYILVD